MISIHCRKGEMPLNTEIRNLILTTDKDAQYDECAKRLLSQKYILAHILVKTVDKRVYSIWICMNMPENSMCHIHLIQDNLVGKHKWDGDLDLINLVMIGISNNLAEPDETHELLRFLGTLFSKDLTSKERISIMEEEYDIPSQILGKEVETMCNLGEGIWEDALEEGVEQGEEKTLLTLISKKLAKGKTVAQIADECEETEERIQELMKKL